MLCRLKVPRTRDGFRSQFLPRYQRHQQDVNELVLEAFLRGISTRQVGRVLEPLLGECYSAQTISNITRQLDHAVAQFHRRPLRDDYVYLYLDGIVLKMRDLSAQVRRRMVLVAYGVLPNGKREILDYHFAHGESEAAWLEFLQGLFLRGLEGKHLELIVTDGGKGLRAPLPVVFPQVPVQLRWAHKMRNIRAHCSVREQCSKKAQLQLRRFCRIRFASCPAELNSSGFRVQLAVLPVIGRPRKNFSVLSTFLIKILQEISTVSSGCSFPLCHKLFRFSNFQRSGFHLRQ